MDSKFALQFLLLLFSSTIFVTIDAIKPYEQTNQPKPSSGINIGLVSSLLSDKGYQAMALTLDAILEDAVMPYHHNTTTFTLFCPQDHAFFTSKYPQPPLTLLEYHLVPFKFDKATMEASVGHGSKVDTLLPGHPLVVTSLPGSTRGFASLNQVKVTEWDVYNNGQMIVHGVEDFFDPAFQTLRYPQYDAINNVKEDSSRRFSGLKDALEIISWFVLLALVSAFTYVLIRSYIFSNKPYGEAVKYAPIEVA